MSPNPYQPSNPYQPPDPYGYPRPLRTAAPATPTRTLFVLAGVGSIFAAVYWALFTLLVAFVMLSKSASVSPTQVILPCVLIGLYSVRGYQLFKGDPQAAQRILWLHVVGGGVTLLQIFSGGLGAFTLVFEGIKVAIHVFGAVMAYLARRSYMESLSRPS